MAGTLRNGLIKDNDLQGNREGALSVEPLTLEGDIVIKDNVGLTTKDSGTITVLSESASASHGLHSGLTSLLFTADAMDLQILGNRPDGGAPWPTDPNADDGSFDVNFASAPSTDIPVR